MAKADVMVVFFLLALSFATNNGATTEYASPTVDRVEINLASESETTTNVSDGPKTTVAYESETTTNVSDGPKTTVASESETTTNVSDGPKTTVAFESETTTNVSDGPKTTVASESETTTNVSDGPKTTVASESETTTNVSDGPETTGSSTAPTSPGVTTPTKDAATTVGLPSVSGTTTGAEGNTEHLTTVLPLSTSTTLTTSVTATTTGIPPNFQLPDLGAAPPFNMTFDIGFNKSWSDIYSDESCQSNEECTSFKTEVVKEINAAFEGCPGYLNNSVTEVSFRNGGGNQRARQRVLSSKYSKRSAEVDIQETGNRIYANYNTSYKTEQILVDSVTVITYIGNEAVKNLENADFDGTKALNDSLQAMSVDASTQITSFTEAACPTIGKSVCPNCFPCSEDDAYNYPVSCRETCSVDEICTVADDGTSGCTCKANYLPVGDSCVDQNIIIGVSAGVGGAILLALIIALIIVGCRLDKKDKDYDHLVKTQEYRPSTYEMTKVHDTAKGPEYSDIDLVKNSSADHDGHAMELTTFTNVVETEDSAPIAAAAVVHAAGQHSAVDNEYHEANGSVAVRKDPVQEEMKPDYDYPGVAAAVVAGKSIEPESSSHQQHKPAPSDHDRYRNLYYPQANDEEDQYAGFVPRLTMVDTKTEFLITRPKIALKPTSNYKDINSQFF